jgi:hypothetical protein
MTTTRKRNNLSADEVHSIKRLIKEGVSDFEIAEQLSVHKSTIYSIRSGKIWKDDLHYRNSKDKSFHPENYPDSLKFKFGIPLAIASSPIKGRTYEMQHRKEVPHKTVVSIGSSFNTLGFVSGGSHTSGAHLFN